MKICGEIRDEIRDPGEIWNLPLLKSSGDWTTDSFQVIWHTDHERATRIIVCSLNTPSTCLKAYSYCACTPHSRWR